MQSVTQLKTSPHVVVGRAAVIASPHELAVHEREFREPAAGEVRVRIDDAVLPRPLLRYTGPFESIACVLE